MTPPATGHVLSVDMDDLFIGCCDLYGERVPAGYRSRIDHELRFTLDLLSEHHSQATIFVNAQYCQDYGCAVQDAVSRGHVLASHGFHHHDIRQLSISAFAADVAKSIDALSKYQTRIHGYRPPAFSMPFDEAHLRVLLDHGLTYLSSGVGLSRSNAPHRIAPTRLECGLTYVPISVFHVLGKWIKYPIGYGVTSRLLPESLYLMTLMWWLRRRPFFHYYCHPFEVAGLGASAGSLRRRGWLAPRLYAWRCEGRAGLFRRILSSCRFQAIETFCGSAAAERA